MTENNSAGKIVRILLAIWLVLSELLLLASYAGWFLLLSVGYVFQDSPNTPQQPIGVFLLAFIVYPVITIGVSIGAWVAYAFRKNWLVFLLSIAAITPVLLFALYLLYLSI